jgi:hypothetical protein
MTVRHSLLALAAVLSLSPAARALVPVRVSGDQWTKLDKGEIIVSISKPTPDGLRQYQVMGELDAAAPRVWKMLIDFDRHADIFSAVAKSDTRKTLSATRLLNFKELKLPWPINNRWFINDTTLYPDKLAYEWHMTEGNVKTQRGQYDLIPRGAKTLVIYTLYFDPDVAWIPKPLFALAQRVTLPSVIKDTRKAVVRY